ncbi:MAG TPA: hypothetical protein PLN55_08120 [Burkholderiaceae bacterium]|nr:hypothetical protein [Burkholderiaceae bacterium]
MVRLGALALLIGLAGCQPAPPTAADRALAAGDWHRFEANFTAAGQRTELDLGESRHAAILDLRGSMLVSSDEAPARGFGVQVIGFSDTESGFVGRAVWTDERGDKLFSALRGQSVQGGARIEGSFLGGTGRFAGAQGSYEFVWRYVLETEEGKVQGRAQDVRGRLRVGGSAPPAERPS